LCHQLAVDCAFKEAEVQRDVKWVQIVQADQCGAVESICAQGHSVSEVNKIRIEAGGKFWKLMIIPEDAVESPATNWLPMEA
jgi:hypothetical protein